MRSPPEVFDAAVRVLERVACARGVITYKELSDEVPGLPTRGRLMTDLLLDVSDHSWDEHRVLLPVLVVNASGQRLPSTGFYESLRQFRPGDSQDDAVKAARRERERVYSAYPL